MKKMVAVLAVLGVWALILPACGGGSNSGGGGGLWIPVGLARSVDKQFGPVTTVTSSDAAVVALNGGGSHQAIQLKGRMDKAAIVAEAQKIIKEWLPISSIYTPLPKKSGLGSKLEALASKAGSVDSNPCKQDSDNDGIPDILEDKCDPITDTHCDGLCFNPGVDTVKCTSSGSSFTIKFSDCQVNVTTSSNVPPTLYTSIATGVTSSHTTTTYTDYTTFTFLGKAWTVCSDSTTNGTIAKINDWNFTASNTSTGSNCTHTYGPGTVNGVAYDLLNRYNCVQTNLAPCAYWNASSTTLTTAPTFTTKVNCAYGSFANLTNVGSTSTTVSQLIQYPYSPWTTGPRLGTTMAPVHIVLDGSVTVHNGKGGVDEQVIHTRYNNLTMIWDETGAPDTGTDPFLTLRGETMQYTVLDPHGNPAPGTTFGGPNHAGWNIDGMDIEKVHFESDVDGTNGQAWQTGKGETKGGRDNEDGAFAFTGPSGEIVSITDKNGNYGIHLVGINPANGNPIYNVSAYEKGEGEANKCGVPANAPCKITLEINPKLRLLTVTAISGCKALDANDIPKLSGINF